MAISKCIKYIYTEVLTWGKLHYLPIGSCFGRFQFKQQIATVTQAFHMPCIVTYVKNTKSFFGWSRIHLRGNWQVSTASGHLCLPHLNIALGIYLVSFHNNFRNALRVWVLKPSEEFYLYNWIARSIKRSRAQGRAPCIMLNNSPGT